MRYLGPEGLAALKDLIKKALDGKANKTHTHEKSEIGDYVDYELPVASDETLGGVKIGEGLEIDEDGVLNTAIKELEWDKVQNKPTKVSEFENDAGYITSIPEEYITENELDEKGFLTSIPNNYITQEDLDNLELINRIPEEYITETELNEKGYLTSFTETDPVFQASPSYGITQNDIDAWREKASTNDIPTKTSQLENDSHFLVRTDPWSQISGRLHVYNTFDSNSTKVDLSVSNIQGASLGGSSDTLYLNRYSDKNVRILSSSKGGKLYYDDKEVATQEYVDKQIANIEFDSENIDLTDYAKKEYVDEQISNIEISGGYSLPIASSETLGGIKVGANLTIDEDGTLNATASSTGDGSVMVDTVPIGTVILYDGEEIPDGYEEVEDYVPTYSTEEQRIGTWIDGKPIYRKSYELSTHATSGTVKIISIPDVNYEIITNAWGTTYWNSSSDTIKGSTIIPYRNSDSDYCKLWIDSGSIQIQSSFSNRLVYVHIEYTKTTD